MVKYLATATAEAEPAAAPAKPRSNFIGMASNFTVQYNLSVLSIAIKFMTSRNDALIAEDDTTTAPDFPEPEWAAKVLLSMVFAGTIIGMVGMGYVGDVFGRRVGMLATLSLVILGSLASAFLSWGDNVYLVIVICRLLIGIGVGGMYPNAAALSAESTGEGEDDGERVGWAFFWQTPGSMSPYVVAYALLLLPTSLPALTSLQFRAMLAFGAVPAAVVWVAAFLLPVHAGRGSGSSSVNEGGEGGGECADAGEDGSFATSHPLAMVRAHPEHFATLMGTAGTWCLYDVSCYGTSVFTPQILQSIFSGSDTIGDLCWQALASSVAGLLGILAAIPMIKRYGGSWLSLWGFVLMSVCFAAFAALYMVSATGLSGAKFAVFCCLTFSLGWGCNLSTYVLPTQLFPCEIRTTFHGLSAAAGKVGAVIGTFLFEPVRAAYGVAGVMWLQVAICVAGGLISFYCVPDASPAALKKRRSAAAGRAGKGMSSLSSASFNGDDNLGGDDDEDSNRSLLDQTRD